MLSSTNLASGVGPRVGALCWRLCFVFGLLVDAAIKSNGVCVHAYWPSLLCGFLPTKGVGWWFVETGCALKGVYVSFKGDRCCPARSDQRASLTLSPHPVGRPFRPSGFLPWLEGGG